MFLRVVVRHDSGAFTCMKFEINLEQSVSIAECEFVSTVNCTPSLAGLLRVVYDCVAAASMRDVAASCPLCRRRRTFLPPPKYKVVNALETDLYVVGHIRLECLPCALSLWQSRLAHPSDEPSKDIFCLHEQR